MRSILPIPTLTGEKGRTGGKETKIIVVLTSIVFLVAWVVCVFKFPPTDDVINFFNNAELMKSGLMPYRDFVFEFPPLSLIFFLIPSLFTSDLTVYSWLFGLQVTVSAIITQYVLMKICERAGINRGLVALLFGLFVMMYFPESLKKFDMMVMMSTTVAFYCYVDGKRTWAYALLAVGAFIKMYPALFIPLLITFDLADKGVRGLRDVIKGLAACAVVGIIPLAVLCIYSIPLGDVFSFLGFHSDRGFQVESFLAIIIQTLSLLGLTSFELIGSHWTYDVVNPVCDALQPYWLGISAVMLLVAWVAVIVGLRYRGRMEDESERFRLFMASVGVVMIVFLLTNKVFSTQYVIWLFPIIAILSVVGRDRFCAPFMVMSVAVLFFTMFIVLNDSGTPPFIVANMIRDICLVVILFMLSYYLISNRGPMKNDNCDGSRALI